jgi:hypothetical protein
LTVGFVTLSFPIACFAEWGKLILTNGRAFSRPGRRVRRSSDQGTDHIPAQDWKLRFCRSGILPRLAHRRGRMPLLRQNREPPDGNI